MIEQCFLCSRIEWQGANLRGRLLVREPRSKQNDCQCTVSRISRAPMHAVHDVVEHGVRAAFESCEFVVIGVTLERGVE